MFTISKQITRLARGGNLSYGDRSVLNYNGASLSKSLYNSHLNSLHNSNIFSTRTTRISQRSFASTPQSVPMSNLSESFLDGTSANYVEQMYIQWNKDPSSVHSSWSSYFSNVNSGAHPGSAFQLSPSMGGPRPSESSAGNPSASVTQKATESMRLLNLVSAYQVFGHHAAKLDPLNQVPITVPEQLKYSTYGFTESDLDKEYYIGQEHFSGFLSKDRPKMKLRDIIKRLEETYCGTIGVEYTHMQDAEALNWIKDKFETQAPYSFDKEEKIVVLDRLTWATHFERYIGMKFGNSKRFGVDGAESLIPGLKALIDRSADLGVEHVVIGMPHRGRLNVLANVVRKPVAAIFHEFVGATAVEDEFYTGSGDVKYHLGTSYMRPTRSGKTIHLSLLANPSHLEAVNPVVEGKARATQYIKRDTKFEKVVSLQLHGDAAFAGQGIVYETLGLSGLPNYTTGGTIHIICNNQIGFTTDPTAARGTRYCTDIAKAAGVPVFHVNADDAEAVVHVFQIAAEWRQKFHKDAVIDLIGYRRFGHNEGDEPRFTQPQMYKKIDAQRPTLEKYSDELKSQKVVTDEQVDEIKTRVIALLGEAHKESATYKPGKSDWLESEWKGFSDRSLIKLRPTAIKADAFKKIGEAVASAPVDFTIHPTIRKVLSLRKAMVDSGENVDWAVAEGLAFGSLLMEGTHVRLSGQDVERGTFSHRHGVLHDQNSNKIFIPLNNLDAKQEKFVISNSSLSEYGVLGFELGYSLTHPNSLVMWEAQFGDFANGAQIMIDQFVCSGETKWKRQSGLVMLLPHGYDGQGPEHSSARLERFLQLTDADPDVIPTETNEEKIIQKTNLQIVNITTPANYFHALRRQVHRGFRKPLVVMSPKNLLKHRSVISSMREFTDPDVTFKTVIGETHTGLVEDQKVERVLFCSGKVFYELWEEREARKIKNIAIVRIEQLHPFPFAKVQEQMNKYSKAQVAWVQEEPKNMGAWSFVDPHLRTAARQTRGDNARIIYNGRPAAASPATGYGSEHKSQLAKFMDSSFSKTK